jgi:integrase
MTFADLWRILEDQGVLPRPGQLKTSLRYLAAALGYDTLEACVVEEVCREEATWSTALETHFRTLTAQGLQVSAGTRRNTRNNLRVLFRHAEAHGLLQQPLPVPLLTKAKRVAFQETQRATNPYQSTYYVKTGPRRFGLPEAQWPADIQAGWRDYQAKCGLGRRATTFRTHTKSLMTFWGYLTHICERQPTWDDLFHLPTLREFLRWHSARMGRRISVHGRSVVILAAAIAVVLEHKDRRALADFRNSLPTPAPLHIKRNHWISLAELERVAEACLAEGREPYIFRKKDRYPGVRRATTFQVGVILKLLVRVPLRQRNVREMRLGHNLFADEHGHWWLHFEGDELKIGEKRGRANVYKRDLTEVCADLLPVLEEWQRDYRPRLPGAATSPLVFLTYRGNPFTQRSLHEELGVAVARRTGKRFYPHLIRTIWTTEYLKSQEAPDFVTAAEMLGDEVGIVMRTYHDVVRKDQEAKAKAFLGTALQG